MPSFEDSIDVDIPIHAAYDQWTRFEEYPSFMPTVKHLDQRDDKTLDVISTFAGKRTGWTAEITDQTPNVRVAWKSTTGGGSVYATTVLLQPLGEDKTRVTMKADIRPETLLETVAVNLGLPLLKRRVKGDLTGFKRFIGSRRA